METASHLPAGDHIIYAHSTSNSGSPTNTEQAGHDLRHMSAVGIATPFLATVTKPSEANPCRSNTTQTQSHTTTAETRHSYAQRHADAGVPIDVLAELLDHRSYTVTRRYYRIGEDRRRDAVDKVTALSFDRHGNRIWRDAQALLESEGARHAIGEVAVPYGTCTEPTNVQAGGGACPVRYRCVGCDFASDRSFLDELRRQREATLNPIAVRRTSTSLARVGR